MVAQQPMRSTQRSLPRRLLQFQATQLSSGSKDRERDRMALTGAIMKRRLSKVGKLGKLLKQPSSNMKSRQPVHGLDASNSYLSLQKSTVSVVESLADSLHAEVPADASIYQSMEDRRRSSLER